MPPITKSLTYQSKHDYLFIYVYKPIYGFIYTYIICHNCTCLLPYMLYYIHTTQHNVHNPNMHIKTFCASRFPECKQKQMNVNWVLKKFQGQYFKTL